MPQTVVPFEKTPLLLYFFGSLIAAAGLTLRTFARWLAWPEEWSYTGSRESTRWAYREELYRDLGLVALAFGLSLVWLGIWKRVR